jgi:hypothetical protein
MEGIHPVVNKDSVKRWTEQQTEEQDPTPEEEGKVIEKVVNERRFRGRTQFLVRWQGQGPEADFWLDERSIDPQLKKAFRQLVPRGKRQSKRIAEREGRGG